MSQEASKNNTTLVTIAVIGAFATVCAAAIGACASVYAALIPTSSAQQSVAETQVPINSSPINQPTPISTMSAIEFTNSIDKYVQSLKFFESGMGTPPMDQRTYVTSFAQSTTRYINWELLLSYPPYRGQRIDFTIHAVYYGPNGNMYAQMDLPSYAQNDWSGSYHSTGWGSDTAGTWPSGSYMAVLYVSDHEIARGTFVVK
jgi:hypothetical protein